MSEITIEQTFNEITHTSTLVSTGSEPLRVLGVIRHGALIKPKSAQDRAKLVRWLTSDAPRQLPGTNLNERELAIVLSALRHIQNAPLLPGFQTEIDELCERLNCGDPKPSSAQWSTVSLWDNHHVYRSEQWADEVISGDTRLGYVDWVNAQIEQEIER